MNENIKVLHIISSLHQGGAERQLLELVKNNSHHAVCQLFSGGIYEKELKKNNILLFSLNVKKNILLIIAIFRLFIILKSYKPDIIHTWMYHSSLLGLLLKKITFKRNTPLIWGLRCSNMDVSKYSKILKLVIKCCKLLSKMPNIIINNSIAGLNFHKNIKFKNKNSIVIQNGIDTDRFISNTISRKDFRSKFKIGRYDKVLLCVGRYDPMKDHDTLLKSYRRIRKEYSSTVLILAGEGTKNIKTEEGVISLGLCEEISEVYSGSDIIISSSSFGEGFSNAIAEGMSSNLVPISTKVGDAEYIIGDVGITVAPNDVFELYKAIKSIIELDNQLFLNKKVLARERIVKKFSKLKMLYAYDKIYNQLIKDTKCAVLQEK